MLYLNRDIRSGPLVVGRREYRVRTVSRSNEVEQLEAFVLRRDPSGTVYLGDVARAQFGRRIRDRALIRDGEPTVAVGIIRQVGGNVPKISQGIRTALVELEERFDREGEGIAFDIPYDENDYINDSISFVRGNLIIGAILASLVLMLLGMTGAVLSLVVANLIPGIVVPLDMITGLGFMILTGVVVNNAILLVDRALQLQDMECCGLDEALYHAVRDRLRPIFMSAGTSVLGMLPLAVFPGKGAELYQGLGIALTGGLALATFLTPTVVPAIMHLLSDITQRKSRQLKPDLNVDYADLRSEPVLAGMAGNVNRSEGE